MKIGIVGLGLMGGSLGRALVKRTEHTVYASDIDPEAMTKGALLSAYHEELTPDNAGELDMLFLAVVPSVMDGIMQPLLPRLKEGALVSDLAGVKRPVVALMKEWAKVRPDLNFVGGHPMAGREFSGVAHSVAGLYEGASVLLVPVSNTIESLAALKKLGAGTFRSSGGIAKVSIVGVGMTSHPGVAGTLFRALADAGINSELITTSEIKISVGIAPEQADAAVRAIHAAFGLQN